MSLSLTQSKTALAVNLTASFLAAGGTTPFVYSVRANGAGGSIDSSSGLYTAPATVNQDPKKLFDTIQVKDSTGAIATAQIMVGTPLHLFCEIIQREMSLAVGRVWIFDQKIFQPTDDDLYISVSVPSCKPYASRTTPAIIDGEADWSQASQSINMLATVDVDIISRSTEALFRKEEVIMAVGGTYAEFQQDANSFLIGKLPPGARFTNLSLVDGAAIPYRYRISLNMQYAVTKQKPVDYFDTFQSVQVTANP